MANKTIQQKIRRARIATPDSEIDRAIAYARRLRGEPVVNEVEYMSGSGLDLLVLKLSDGHRHVIPREDLQGLESATTDQISHIEILGGGTGLHWPDLNVDLYVPALLRGISGNRQWMAKIGRRGGEATSPAKKKASRANGKLGGRPTRSTAAGD
ncbi:MAG TPA: DUF2442 domain-containing protein [Candidatus Acidoferrales bacterium]|nr:DUF2442 domain-containing protein [Candidatus Acidoferrales bacterium]